MEIDDMFDDDEDRDISLSLAGKVEKQEQVAWVIVENGTCVATRSANFSHISDGQYRLYTAPQPCPDCEKLKAEVSGWKLTLDQVVSETANELGFQADNEEILAAIFKLKAERDELAAQVEKMREFLQFLWRDAPLNEYTFGRLEEILALPDLSTSIMNRVRAEAPTPAGAALKHYAGHLRALAADMEAGK